MSLPLPPAASLSIAAVERDTGLSKDTLRVWERRYGFPTPQRDAVGERLYSAAEVEKLRLVKRLLDAGHRPGRVVPLSLESLAEIGSRPVDPVPPGAAESASTTSEDLQVFLDPIVAHDVAGLRSALAHALLRCGVARFVFEVVTPLNAAVGDAWIRGQMEVFEEHTYTEAMQSVLRQAIARIPEPAATAPGSAAAQRPNVLLGTLPGEPHGLGLLMAEAIFALEGCRCTSLGTQTPLWDIVLAAQAYRSDIVALGFSGCMNPNQVVQALAELRAKLPATVALWAGGTAPVLHRRRVAGVLPLASLQEVHEHLKAPWRGQPAGPGPARSAPHGPSPTLAPADRSLE